MGSSNTNSEICVCIGLVLCNIPQKNKAMSSSGDNLHKAKEKIYIVNMIETSLFKTHLEGKIQKEMR
jgi:hypothetical protein